MSRNGNSLKQSDGDVGTPQRVWRDPFADVSGASQTPKRCCRVVWLHPATPFVAQQRQPVVTTLDDTVDRLLRSRVQHHLGRLVALAQDSQGGLIPRAAEVGDVRTARL
jgi:hypothetical protein